MLALPALAAPKGDRVTGNGWNHPVPASDVAEFHIDAKSGPNGENPTGKVSFKKRSTGATIEGPVICLNVVGNIAGIGVDISKTKKTNDAASGILVWVEDNGKKVHGQSPDEIRSMEIYTNQPPTTCPPIDPARMPLQKGDIKVVDTVPAPPGGGTGT